MENNYDIIILGAGPAGLTAGIYAARARAKVLILDEGIAGGQLILTHEVANYPGIENTSGFMLANTMKQQAEKFGCKIVTNTKIEELKLQDSIKKVRAGGQEYSARAVIITTGGRSRTIGVPGEAELKGRGISYCATCDGDFFTGKDIIVVGGGNTALEEAVSLTKYAKSVQVVHMLDHWQAFDYAVKEAENNEKISFRMESKITAFKGKHSLEAVTLEHIPSGEKTDIPIDGTFVFIGYVPGTEFLENTGIELNERKEILVNQDLATNLEGVYAAGDNREKRYRQITTAVADGTIASLAALDYLHTK